MLLTNLPSVICYSSEPDPFAWTTRNTTRRRDSSMVHLGNRSSPVTVAAVDLTQLSSPLPIINYHNYHQSNRPATVSAADTTIDLTAL